MAPRIIASLLVVLPSPLVDDGVWASFGGGDGLWGGHDIPLRQLFVPLSMEFFLLKKKHTHCINVIIISRKFQ